MESVVQVEVRRSDIMGTFFANLFALKRLDYAAYDALAREWETMCATCQPFDVVPTADVIALEQRVIDALDTVRYSIA